MFHWICPECGREIAPTVRECPACDPNAAPAEVALVGVVEAPTARVLDVEAPLAQVGNVEAPLARAGNVEAPLARAGNVEAPRALAGNVDAPPRPTRTQATPLALALGTEVPIAPPLS